MSIIYSHIPPLRVPEGGITIQTCLKQELSNSDALIIATGYASKNSIVELNNEIKKCSVRNVILILGMYYVEGGFPESIYNAAISVNEEWKQKHIGEIRVVKSIKYHGKVYGFYKNGELVSSIIGSHNLGAIVQEAGNLRQYEISLFTDDKRECSAIDKHLKELCLDNVSIPIDQIPEVRIIREENTKLRGVEGVSDIHKEDVQAYKHSEMDLSFEIPLKVPGIPGDNHTYMGSNINKCYAKGRENKKSGVVIPRDWWETEIIVPSKIRSKPGYPEYKVPFWVVTDDGWMFKVHASGDHNKNLESVSNLKILGYWLKGRLVASGLVEPVDTPLDDLNNYDEALNNPYSNCKGVITYATLERYGRKSVTLTKTSKQLADDEGKMLNVWTLSFLPDRN